MNRSMPEAQVVPELSYPDVNAAAEWLCSAFGFEVRLRIADHRVQLAFGSGAIILKSGAVAPETCSSHSIMVRVEGIDDHCARAIAGGAKVPGPPTTYPYGERQYAAEDFSGHWWVFSESVEDVHPSVWGGALAHASDGKGER